MTYHSACKCPESKKSPLERAWLLVKHNRATSKVECAACGSVWNTPAKYRKDLLAS